MNTRFFLIPLLLLCLPLAVFCPQIAKAETWAIYWYVCGSDLEQRFGGASADILEAVQAEISDDVTVIMQTGGTKKWQIDMFDSKKIGRYRIRKDSVEKLQILPQANMGKPETLSSFLQFCDQHVQADHRILIIWDHGGGSTGELARDQNFDMQGLSLFDIRKALQKLYKANPEQPHFDLIGFDACLMGSLDVANALHGFAHYMVASEEVESGNGWFYTPMLTQLSRKPNMSVADFGKIICDTYMQGCIEARESGYDPSMKATLSLIDLSYIPYLKIAWDLLGLEAVNTYTENNAFLATLGREANASEKFFNSPAEGFSNMMDLGAFIQKIQKHLPEFAETTLDLLKETVIYNVTGLEHKKAMGLSCYYPFDGGQTFKTMLNKDNRSIFVVLQGLQLNKFNINQASDYLLQLIAKNEQAIAEWDQEPSEKPAQTPADSTKILADVLTSAAQTLNERLKPLPTFDISTLEDTPITVNKNGDAILNLGQEKVRYLDSVYFDLAYFDEKQDIFVFLGRAGDLHSDWQNGIFRSNFRNTWAEIDGNLVALDITNKNNYLCSYAIPVKLNGERVNLQAIYDYAKKQYTLTGARRVMDNGEPDKYLIKLKAGDRITTLFHAAALSADADDLSEVEIDTFTWKKDSKIVETSLGDGQFFYMFEMNDIQGNSANSAVAIITVKGNNIQVVTE